MSILNTCFEKNLILYYYNLQDFLKQRILWKMNKSWKLALRYHFCYTFFLIIMADHFHRSLLVSEFFSNLLIWSLGIPCYIAVNGVSTVLTNIQVCYLIHYWKLNKIFHLGSHISFGIIFLICCQMMFIYFQYLQKGPNLVLVLL